MALYAEGLRRHRDEIDSLNVFPVADGDTGTNLLLTLEAVDRRLADLDSSAPWHVVGEAILESSLLGARGNSGVILSQVLRGFLQALPEEGGGVDVARALAEASREADRAVAAPAEGTMLSVLRDAAGAATSAAASAEEVEAVLDVALAAARDSLRRTTELLPALREAGVVDAGALGLVLLLDALRAAVTGGELTEAVGAMGPVNRVAAQAVPPSAGPATEVEFILEAPDERVVALRGELARIGDSVVVVGGGGRYHVHVHTDTPDDATAAGARAGRLGEVSMVALLDRLDPCIADQARGVRVAEAATALVASADGQGLMRTLRSLGATVLPGSCGVADLVSAVEASPPREVLLLPAHPDLARTANDAAAGAAKPVRVIVASSIPAALAAAAAFNATAPFEENVEGMEAAVASTVSGEVVRAPAGWTGRIDGHAVVEAAASPADAIEELVRKLSDGRELLTLVAGRDATDGELEVVRTRLRSTHPELELSEVWGDQPGAPYVIGLE
jgi:DAK2 domain fusion protein YloV